MTTLEELEGVRWPDPGPDATRLVRTCSALRGKALESFTVEDLRIMLSQQVGVEHLLPLAVRLLVDDPLAEGDLYPGDLLTTVMGLPPDAWAGLARERALLGERVIGLEVDDPHLRQDLEHFASGGPAASA